MYMNQAIYIYTFDWRVRQKSFYLIKTIKFNEKYLKNFASYFTLIVCTMYLPALLYVMQEAQVLVMYCHMFSICLLKESLCFHILSLLCGCSTWVRQWFACTGALVTSLSSGPYRDFEESGNSIAEHRNVNMYMLGPWGTFCPSIYNKLLITIRKATQPC